jgi:hypothetical protein
MQRLECQQLAPNFLALALKSKLRIINETNKASVFIEATEFILSNLSERATLSHKTAINTKSNLSSQVFKEITLTLGIDYNPYQSKEKLIDEKLLFSRNNIAHGERLTIDQSDYFALHEQVIELINLFRNQIDNSASTKSYRRLSP